MIMMVRFLLLWLLIPGLVFAQGAAITGPSAPPAPPAPQKVECEEQLAIITRFAQTMRQRDEMAVLGASQLSIQLEKAQERIKLLMQEAEKMKAEQGEKN